MPGDPPNDLHIPPSPLLDVAPEMTMVSEPPEPPPASVSKHVPDPQSVPPPVQPNDPLYQDYLSDVWHAM